MDPTIVYAKTPTGDEAVRQSTRVVQRNLRMVLVQVDGKMTAGEMAAKIGNPRLVESALRELEEGGFIAPTVEAVTAWEEGVKAARIEAERAAPAPMSQFSTFAPKSGPLPELPSENSALSQFSTFDAPAYPSPEFRHEPLPAPKAAVPKPGFSFPELPRISLKKIIWGGLLSILIAAAGLLAFYPLNEFKPQIESVIGRAVNGEVHVDALSLAVSPSPHLKISNVRIGQPADSLLGEIRIYAPWWLLRPSHRLDRVEILGARIASGRLPMMPIFRGETQLGDHSMGPLLLKDFRVHLNQEVDSPELNGEIRFQPDGAIEKAAFETPDRTLLLTAKPAQQGFLLTVEGRAWTPGGSALGFSALQANALLSSNRLVVQNIDTTFLGGILRGNWALDWSYGLAMSGEFSLNRADARKVSAALAPQLKMEGDINALIRLKSRGRDWGALWDQSEANASLEMLRGALSGIDLGEAARRAGGEVRAGNTRFDRLRTTINVMPRGITLQDIRMDAGMMMAVGQANATREGMVDGAMNVTMQTSVSSTVLPVRISGRLPDLTANGRK